MIQIRKGFFETNSSSTHSITLGDAQEMSICTSLRPNKYGTVIIDGGCEFGWEQDTYYDAKTKSAYAWIIIRDWSEPTDIFSPDSKSKEERLKMFENVIKNQTGCREIVYFDDSGYIDHQSVEGDAYNWLFESEEVLHNFIFNKNSILETDNDNH